MSKLIDADALKNAFSNMYREDYERWIKEVIDNTPTVEERPKGKWVGDTDYESFQGSYEAYKCSNCGYSLHWRDYYADEYIFCPYCGADMRGDV